MDYKGKRVLLLDGYGRQIPTLMKQLHQLGCEITTINDSKLDIGYASRYPKNKFVIRGCREDDTGLKAFVEKALRNNDYDVIFPVLERSTDLMLSLKEEGKLGNAKLVCAPRDAFMKAYDKLATMRACMENGIPCPLTKMDDESLDSFLQKIEFPLACKPRKGSGSAGFHIVRDKQHLDELIADGSIVVDNYVIQEYIPHTDYHYGVYIMFNGEGNPCYTVPVQSCRQFPVDGGPGCYIRTVNNEQLIKDSERLMSVLGWKGFGHVGFIMDPRDHTAKVMEINGRIPAGIKICNIVGYPTVKLLMDMVYGEKVEKLNIEIPNDIGMRHFQADFMWFIKSPDRFRAKPTWFRFWRSYDYVFSWKDPWPFITYTLEHVLSYKKEIKKRQH